MSLRIAAWIHFAGLSLAMALASANSFAQTADTLRGRVTTDSGAAIVGAEVVATRAPDRAFKSALSDQNGNYHIVFEQGTGDYLLHVSALGRERARVRVKRANNETELVHDFQLKSSVQQLERVTVSAERQKPERDVGFIARAEPGESGKGTDGVTGAVPPGAQGNIATTAATVPGVMVTPTGISVLGLGPDQNSTTLNGMAFSGTDLPRSARTNYRVNASTFDPARGWFGGVLVNADLQPGNYFSFRNATLTVDAPPFQYADRISSALGQKVSSVVAGIGGGGAFAQNKMNYSYGADIKHRSSSLSSLEDANGDLLQYVGVAGDSAVRLLGIMSAAGIPLSAPVRTNPNSDDLVFIGRIDHASRNTTTNQSEKQTWGLIGYAKAGRSTAVGVGPTAPALHGGEASEQIYSVQGVFSSYWHDNTYLTDARSAFSLKRDRTTPYLNTPEGRVLVSSDLSNALNATTSLAFGGNSSLKQDAHDWTWETSSLTRFYTSAHSHHRVQLAGDSRIDGFAYSTAGNSNGAFSFNSLADVAANIPSAFTRTLNAPRRSGAEWNAFASLGDYWRKSQTFQLLYGLRLEGNRFLDRPAYNPEVDRLFGARTDRTPAGLDVSPRIGFTWIRVPAGQGIRFSPVGTFNMGPPSYLRGGIGEFRSLLPANVLAQPIVATGLPGGAMYLTCIGPAAPIPDWSGYMQDPATIPRQCANGTTGQPSFADAAPSVQLFDRSYSPPRSWRGNLGYASTFRRLSYSLEGIYSLNIDQPSHADLNFNNVQKFTTAGESRPVFVSPQSIVASTGLVSPLEARRSTTLGSVISNGSDSRSVSRRATLIVSPKLEDISNWVVSVAYTLSSMRTRVGGFDAPNFASPLIREWARGDLDARHQFVLQAGRTIKRVTFSLFGHVQSGLPFTPLVGGDVNGDGIWNDRAFIFGPNAAPDSATNAGLRALATNGPSRFRNCLARQFGRAAGRNSCEGPWTAALNGQLTSTFEIPHSMGRYATIAIAIANPLGGLDQLLHGSAHLRGWGAFAVPDPILYNVRGFDSVTRQFRYEVNPRFGNTQPANTIARAPFRLTLDVSVNIGTPLPVQQLERWVGAGRGGRKGRRLTASELKTHFKRNVPDPYASILEESDSLLLTAEQEKMIQDVQAKYLYAVDSLWTPLTEYLAALGDSFNATETAEKQDAMTDSVWEYTRQDLKSKLPGILSPVQLKLLPWEPAYLYNSKEKKIRIRMYSS